MDILSLTHNVRVGQEVEPRGIKAPEQNLGKEVRETGSPPTRGAPSEIRADRKEASQTEQKSLRQALDLLEAELPIELNFRDLALNKKLRPGIGLGTALSDADLQLENGKPKLKDLLAAIGVAVPATVSTRNLNKLQHSIAETIDQTAVPKVVSNLIKDLIQVGKPSGEDAIERGITSIDSDLKSIITKSFGRPVVTPIHSPAPVPSTTSIELPQPFGAMERAHSDPVERAFTTPPLGAPDRPAPIGKPDSSFIEAPRPGVPQNMLLAPIKVASELGPHKISLGLPTVLPPVDLEAMASILNKGLSPTALRDSIIARSFQPAVHVAALGKPTLSYGSQDVRIPAASLFKADALHYVHPVSIAHAIKATYAATALIAPTLSYGGSPPASINPEPPSGGKPTLNGPAPPLSLGKPTLSYSGGRGITKSWSGLEYPLDLPIDRSSPQATNLLDGARRTVDGSALRQAATSAVASVHESIVDHIQEIAASQGRGRVVIRLQPEDLGTITVSVRSFGQRVEADIRASNDAVRDALVANRGDLVQSVESKGLSLNSFNVGQEAGDEAQTSDQRTDGNRDMRQEFERFANLSQASRKDVPVTAAAPAPWFAPSTEVVDYTI